ncbi:MAG: prepilin-type N-terminal cleavage/methylation domain-containing protein [Candidatus Brocadiia bacterium]
MTNRCSDQVSNGQDGFTLIEMLIVAGIILLAATIVTWSYAGQVRTQRIRSAASSIVAYLELARSDALRQQIFPGLLTNPTAYASVPQTPQYWPFRLHVYKTTVDGDDVFTISVIAQFSPSLESGDLASPIVLPDGISLLKATGGTTSLGAGDRPVFYRDFSAPDTFVTGAVVGAANGIVVADSLDNTQKITIYIDPVYGTISTKDETK